MYRIIERTAHPTQNARPDLMPLGGVLLALVAIFATHMPQASTRLIQDVGHWGCGLCFDCGQPREITVSQDRHGQIHMNSRPASIPMLQALLEIEQAQSGAWIVVSVDSDPEVEYGQAVALIGQIQAAGIPSHRIRISESPW